PGRRPVTGSAVTATLLIMRSPVKVRLAWQPDMARHLIRFGVPLIGAGALNQLILNTDYVIVNRYLGTAVAGAYFLAFNISNWPMTLISFSMRRTAVAGFARLQGDPAAIQRAFVGAATLLISATLPMALLIGLLAPEVLTVAYGPKWAIGATALRFLAGISVVRLFYSLCIELLAALGHTTGIFLVQVAWWLALIAGMWWGAVHHGLVGVGVAQFAAALGVAMPVLFWLLHSHQVRPSQLLPRLARPLLGGMALAVVVFAVRAAFDASVARLLIGGAAGVAAYAVVVLPGTPALASARRLARARRPVAHS
ncbi:MAG: oligosaccharide flippase family protein, partial [Acidimicrobiia bacterium]|nr:oligosaccharide flippase family protein [Acidimicrobiia bacterium]